MIQDSSKDEPTVEEAFSSIRRMVTGGPAASTASPPPPPAAVEAPLLVAEDGLVSTASAAATTDAMARLARAAAPEPAAAETGTGPKTVDALMAELLKPMLKDWLDQNLPALVERIVEQEVKKLARRAELR